MPAFNKSTLLTLKTRIIKYGEYVADVVFNVLLHPAWFSRVSLAKINKIGIGSWFRYDYVFHQKEQRLQLLAKMRSQGCRKPPKFHAWWLRGWSNNFGDLLTAYILSLAAHIDCVFDRSKPFIAVGSIIQRSLDGTRVWGSGIIHSSGAITTSPACLAVRGPLTRERVLAAGLQCPEIYGDPAMLLPYLYSPPKPEKKYDLSLAPHFSQADLREYGHGAHFIDVKVKSIQDIEAVIDQVLKSKTVITSSLHILVMCVAYGISVTVFQITGRSIYGDNIKFRDFCLGVNCEPIPLFEVKALDDETIENLHQKAKVYHASWDPVPLLKSLQSCISTPRLSDLIKQLGGDANASCCAGHAKGGIGSGHSVVHNCL
jgi:hypothetical protein